MQQLPWYILLAIALNMILGQCSVEVNSQPEQHQIKVERRDLTK